MERRCSRSSPGCLRTRLCRDIAGGITKPFVHCEGLLGVRLSGQLCPHVHGALHISAAQVCGTADARASEQGNIQAGRPARLIIKFLHHCKPRIPAMLRVRKDKPPDLTAEGMLTSDLMRCSQKCRGRSVGRPCQARQLRAAGIKFTAAGSRMDAGHVQHYMLLQQRTTPPPMLRARPMLASQAIVLPAVQVACGLRPGH